VTEPHWCLYIWWPPQGYRSASTYGSATALVQNNPSVNPNNVSAKHCIGTKQYKKVCLIGTLSTCQFQYWELRNVLCYLGVYHSFGSNPTIIIFWLRHFLHGNHRNGRRSICLATTCLLNLRGGHQYCLVATTVAIAKSVFGGHHIDLSNSTTMAISGQLSIQQTPQWPSVSYGCHWIFDISLLDFDPMVILRATSILGGQGDDV
jgi:hypothetical protein